jgi:hypothetical protein
LRKKEGGKGAPGSVNFVVMAAAMAPPPSDGRAIDVEK